VQTLEVLRLLHPFSSRRHAFYQNKSMKKLLINSLDNFENSSQTGEEGKQRKVKNTVPATSDALWQQHVCYLHDRLHCDTSC